ncbi:MAG: hypothetical protein WC490_02355 [Candidatus Margulisiibacteriota bacterium]
MSDLIVNNGYWQKISSDKKIDGGEIREFNPKNTGLTERDCKKVRAYLWEALANSKTPCISSDMISTNNIEVEANAADEGILGRIGKIANMLKYPSSVSKAGRNDLFELIEGSRKELLQKLGISIETVPNDRYQEIRSNMILDEKTHRIEIGCYPELNCTSENVVSELPIPKHSNTIKENQFSGLVYGGGRGAYIDNGRLAIQGKMEMEVLALFKEYYSDSDNKDAAYRFFDDLFSRSQKTGYIFRGRLRKPLRDLLLERCATEKEKAAVRDLYERSNDPTLVTQKDIDRFETEPSYKRELFKTYVSGFEVSSSVFTETITDLTQKKLGSTMTPEEWPRWKKELAAYLRVRTAEEKLPLTVENIYGKGFGCALDFLEETDLPLPGEQDNNAVFDSVKASSQGKFSTVCGLYAVLSLFESCGKFEALRSEYSLNSYRDLDYFTAGLLIKHRPHRFGKQNALSETGHRTPGLTMAEVRYIANCLGGTQKVSFEHYEIGDLTIETLCGKLAPGFVAVISTQVGPHAVHVIKAEDGNIVYYDPIGKDGKFNIGIMPSDTFKLAWKKEFGIIAMAHPQKPDADLVPYEPPTRLF